MEIPYKANHEVPGKDQSFWITSTPDTDYPTLSEGVNVDVAILGGGIAGTTTAILLKNGGLNVAVIEAGRIVKGVTGYTTAHISSAQSMYYKKLISHFGDEKARICADSCQASIDMIAKLVKDHHIDCDFIRNSEYVYAASEGDRQALTEELDAEKRLGLPVSYVDRAPLPFEHYGAIRYENQAQFHPRKYLLALAKAIPGDGSFIFENTRAMDIVDGEPCIIKTQRGDLRAKEVVIATHYPFVNLGLLFARMKSIRSYVLGIKAEDDLDNNMYYSTEEPCHYIRTQPTQDGTLVIVGGEDHPTGQFTMTGEKYKNLEKFCREHFKVRSIDYSWSTQDNYTADSVPFIGKYHETKHIYTATGFKGTGMTYGTVSAMLLSDLILKGSSPYQSLYDPGRLKLEVSAPEMLKQNLKVAELFVGERLKSAKPASGLKNGEAAFVTVDGKKVAGYRDETGKLHAVSPRCTHLGCYVEWNDGERTWDCPCHGSRYTYDGKVIHGPTILNLAEEETKDKK